MFWDDQIEQNSETIEYQFGDSENVDRNTKILWLKENQGIKEPNMADNLGDDLTNKIFDR